MKNKKSQAMEFFVNYGWAILFVPSILFALWFFDIIDFTYGYYEEEHICEAWCNTSSTNKKCWEKVGVYPDRYELKEYCLEYRPRTEEEKIMYYVEKNYNMTERKKGSEK